MHSLLCVSHSNVELYFLSKKSLGLCNTSIWDLRFQKGEPLNTAIFVLLTVDDHEHYYHHHHHHDHFGNPSVLYF